jgi:hypothetical protein
MGEYVQPGATAFTRPRGAIRTISFLRLSSSPTWIAAFAAALSAWQASPKRPEV